MPIVFLIDTFLHSVKKIIDCNYSASCKEITYQNYFASWKENNLLIETILNPVKKIIDRNWFEFHTLAEHVLSENTFQSTLGLFWLPLFNLRA